MPRFISVSLLLLTFLCLSCIGQNYKEDYSSSRMQRMQDQKAIVHQENQTLRAWREESLIISFIPYFFSFRPVPLLFTYVLYNPSMKCNN